MPGNQGSVRLSGKRWLSLAQQGSEGFGSRASLPRILRFPAFSSVDRASQIGSPPSARIALPNEVSWQAIQTLPYILPFKQLLLMGNPKCSPTKSNNRSKDQMLTCLG